MPPEIDKILYNLCPPVDQSISCIIINSYSNNIYIDIVSAYFQILGKNANKIGGLWHCGTDLTRSEFWNFIW